MTKPTISLQELRERIGSRAKSAPEHKFWGMYVHIVKIETLEASYLEAKRNGGAPGVDGVTFEMIEETDRGEFLRELATDLEMSTYRPKANRRKEIPKDSGKVRVISIPTIRDRVAQGAMRLVLEPIFEADFSDSSYGARPGRSAHQALTMVKQGLHHRKHRVLDVDLSQYFDKIRHDRVLEKVARRGQDPRVLTMVKQFLKNGGRRGSPQGSPLSPLLANLMLNDLDHVSSGSCDPGVIGACDGCDLGCGVHDPDCDGSACLAACPCLGGDSSWYCDGTDDCTDCQCECDTGADAICS